MEDESIFTKCQPKEISEGLQNFIDSMVEEIVLEGKPFDSQKKYLKKFSEKEGLDYDELEKDIVTFIEILDSFKTAFSNLQVKLAKEKGIECHISDKMVEKLVNHSSQLKPTDKMTSRKSNYLKWILSLVCGVLVIAVALFFFLNDSVEVSEPTGMAEGHGWVDLGLPSGLKWATCNVGASVPSELGYEFAWGETTTKAEYTWKSYIFRTEGDTDENIKFSKYNTESSRGIVDNKMHLDECDDVAHTKWGGSWRMPTAEDILELLDNCMFEWGSLDGIKGFKVTSKINGNSFFLPANYVSLNLGVYWSSSLSSSKSKDAYILGLIYNEGQIKTDSHELSIGYRCDKSPIRPVMEENPHREKHSTEKNDTIQALTNKNVSELIADTILIQTEVEDNKIYSETEVDEKPVLSCGSYKSDGSMNNNRHYNAFMEYLGENAPDTEDWDYDSDFYAHFIVEKDGSMTNISVTYYNRGNGSSSGRTAYCKALAKTLKNNNGKLKWKPGKKNGNPVRVKVSALIMQWG